MCAVYSNPNKKLNKNEIAEGSGNVQCGARVRLAVGRVDVVLFAVRQHHDRIADILASNCVHQLLQTIHHIASGITSTSTRLFVEPPLFTIL